MGNFEDLEVWKISARLAVRIYQTFKEQIDFGFKNQIQRSAVSVPSNIAEGSERNTNKEFAYYLYVAKGSVGELRTQLYIAKEINYLSEEIANEMISDAKKIGANVT